jgi:hypothetical protein
MFSLHNIHGCCNVEQFVLRGKKVTENTFWLTLTMTALEAETAIKIGAKISRAQADPEKVDHFPGSAKWIPSQFNKLNLLYGNKTMRHDLGTRSRTSSFARMLPLLSRFISNWQISS